MQEADAKSLGRPCVPGCSRVRRSIGPSTSGFPTYTFYIPATYSERDLRALVKNGDQLIR